MAYCGYALKLNCSIHRPSFPDRLNDFKISLFSSFKPFLRGLQQLPLQINAAEIIKQTSIRLLDAFVDSMFEFVDQALLPSQSNFAPTEEIEEPCQSTNIQGRIPDDFPEGVYIRNGSNPLFGGFKSTKSIFGRSSHVWIEGEGMLHALYFYKDSDNKWTVFYNNRLVQTETLKLEKARKKPLFLPAVEGDSPAILSAYLLNMLRFGKVNKHLSNTNIFEHSGKYYSISEDHIPQEIDIFSLETLGNWDVRGAWDRPFCSHPKKVPGAGELVFLGFTAQKPHLELGVISADGKKLIHRVDLKLNRCSICHDIGITQRYNVIMDFPLTIDINQLIRGGPLIRYNKEGYARIGVMPHYGDSDSIFWFDVEPCSCFHIFNCFEEGSEVVLRGCRARGSVIPGPDLGLNRLEWFSRGFKHIDLVEENEGCSQDGIFFSRAYEWRLNMQTGGVKERNLTGTEFSMEFPLINENFTGLRNKYGYTQVVDSTASSISGHKQVLSILFQKMEVLSNNKHVQELAISSKTAPPKKFIYKDGIGINNASSPPVLEIPVIDVGLLTSSSPEAAQELQKLRSSLSVSGYFQAINHGFSNEFLDEMHAVTRSFFELPMEEKQKYARTADDIDGYGNDTVHANSQTLDWNDRLYLVVNPEIQRKLKKWPQNPENFRKVLLEFTEKLARMNEIILAAIAKSLNLEGNCFLNQFGEDPTVLARLNLYPPCPRPDLVLAAKAHGDASGSTFLLQDKEVEGLQVLKDDQWYRVPIIPHAIVFNLGDQLEIMTNGIFKSPIHRVVTNTERERITVAIFFTPEPTKEVQPAEGLIDEQRPRLYNKVVDYTGNYFKYYQEGKRPIDALKI